MLKNLKKGMFILKKSLQINDLLTNTDFSQIIKYTLTNELFSDWLNYGKIVYDQMDSHIFIINWMWWTTTIHYWWYG